MTALQVLFDLLHIYGLEIVDANDGSEETSSSSDSGEPLSSSSESKNSDKNGAASKLVAIICSLLDGEVCKPRIENSLFKMVPVCDYLCFCSVLCLLCLCARLFICALWSPAGKGLTSWLSFVVSNCEFVTFPLVSWVRCCT